MGTDNQTPDAAALFATIVLPGALILAGAVVIVLIYAWYTERRNNQQESD